jgi:hypothetical protein
MTHRVPYLLFLAFAVTGCAGSFSYVPPATAPPQPNSIVIDRSIDSVWSRAVPALSKEFFVINNLDKASGLINLSYSGDPEKCVECGRITSYVKNLQGARNYDFPASRAFAKYEVMRGGLYDVERKMSLDGRINVVFEALSPNQTRVTVNTRYVLTRSTTVHQVGGANTTSQESISFDSKNGASFPPPANGSPATTCVANGKLEQTILDIVK